jgi:hypothetical protein
MFLCFIDVSGIGKLNRDSDEKLKSLWDPLDGGWMPFPFPNLPYDGWSGFRQTS